MKKLAAGMLTTAAALSIGMGIMPFAVAPAANADVCAGAHGRFVGVGGCTNVARDVTAVAIASSHVPYFPGEIPCYTVEGVPYFTPPGDPC